MPRTRNTENIKLGLLNKSGYAPKIGQTLSNSSTNRGVLSWNTTNQSFDLSSGSIPPIVLCQNIVVESGEGVVLVSSLSLSSNDFISQIHFGCEIGLVGNVSSIRLRIYNATTFNYVSESITTTNYGFQEVSLTTGSENNQIRSSRDNYEIHADVTSADSSVATAIFTGIYLRQ